MQGTAPFLSTGTGPGGALARDGYCVVPGVLALDFLDELIRRTERRVGAIPAEHRAERRSTGSLIHLGVDPFHAELIAYPPALAALRALGAADLRWSAGFLISKPAHSPALFWHQDWWAWHDPISYAPAMPQVFAMYYLTATRPKNGCLRVIPGSHLRRHKLHGLERAHSDALSRVADPAHDAYHGHPDEVAVPVEPGDMVVGDARLLHGAYANGTDEERSLLTLWYHPDFAALPPAIQSRLVANYRGVGSEQAIRTERGGFPDAWPQPARERIAALEPTCAPGIAPAPFVREPDLARLRPA